MKKKVAKTPRGQLSVQTTAEVEKLLDAIIAHLRKTEFHDGAVLSRSIVVRRSIYALAGNLGLFPRPKPSTNLVDDEKVA